MHIFFCARAYSSEWGFFGHFARSAFRRTPNLTCRDSLFFSLSSCAVFIPSARGRWSSENGKLKSETRKATDKTQLAHRYAFFCSMLVLIPQSGDSSDTSLGVRSVALLQVAKWPRSPQAT